LVAIVDLVGCKSASHDCDTCVGWLRSWVGRLQQLHRWVAMTYGTLVNLVHSEFICEVMVFEKTFDSIKEVERYDIIFLPQILPSIEL
jgi:hypothetical protein